LVIQNGQNAPTKSEQRIFKYTWKSKMLYITVLGWSEQFELTAPLISPKAKKFWVFFHTKDLFFFYREKAKGLIAPLFFWKMTERGAVNSNCADCFLFWLNFCLFGVGKQFLGWISTLPRVFQKCVRNFCQTPQNPPNRQKFLTRRAFFDHKLWTKFYS